MFTLRVKKKGRIANLRYIIAFRHYELRLVKIKHNAGRVVPLPSRIELNIRSLVDDFTRHISVTKSFYNSQVYYGQCCSLRADKRGQIHADGCRLTKAESQMLCWTPQI